MTQTDNDMGVREMASPLITGTYTCLTCRHKQKLRSDDVMELTHAPHCSRCGGPMDIPSHGAAKKDPLPTVKCLCCGVSFVDTNAMCLHLQLNDECYKFSDAAEEYVKILPDRWCFTKTVHLVRVGDLGNKRTIVRALCPNRTTDDFVTFPEKAQAVSFIQKRFPRDITRIITESGQELTLATKQKKSKKHAC